MKNFVFIYIGCLLLGFSCSKNTEPFSNGDYDCPKTYSYLEVSNLELKEMSDPSKDILIIFRDDTEKIYFAEEVHNLSAFPNVIQISNPLAIGLDKKYSIEVFSLNSNYKIAELPFFPHEIAPLINPGSDFVQKVFVSKALHMEMTVELF